MKWYGSKEFYFLIYITLIWALVVYINKNLNPNSKHSYYVKSDEEFMIKFNSYLDSSLSSLAELKKWISENYKQASLASPNDSLFNNLALVKRTKDASSSNKILCVGMISKKRLGDRLYPIQTVVSLLTRVKLKYQDRILLDIFNMDKAAALNTDLNFVNSLVNIVNVNTNVDFSMQIPKVKEAFDYASVMEFYANERTDCDYVALIEDDSIACLNWYEKLIEALENIDSSYNLWRKYFNSNYYTSNFKDASQYWMCLKLFTSFRSFDWLSYPLAVLNFVFFVAITSILKTAVFNYFFKRKVFFVKRSAKFYKPFIVLSSLILNFWLMSTSISPLGYGVKQYSIGFNTVANVYPKHVLGSLSGFIKSSVNRSIYDASQFMPKDLLLNKFRYKYGLNEFIVEPALFQHIGLQSSLSSSVSFDDLYLAQYRVFQSYSFFKEHFSLIKFDPNFWLN